jgi:hypothetical protein
MTAGAGRGGNKVPMEREMCGDSPALIPWGDAQIRPDLVEALVYSVHTLVHA